MRSTRMRVLVIRSSAMGDVALSVPVILALRESYPGAEIVMVTRKPFNAFFLGIGDIFFINPDYNGKHRGVWGLLRLKRKIDRNGSFDYVVDLHDVLRSKLLRFFFYFRRGVRVAVIDKARGEKKRVLKGERKMLKHVTERYADAFRRVGLPLRVPVKKTVFSSAGASFPELSGKKINIGIAPYAMHSLKVWPEEKMRDLLFDIVSQLDAHILLFGGGRDECEKLAALSDVVPGATNMCGRYTLEEEIMLIGSLDAMITMDSANMHLAALSGTKVISIWGATHQSMGFMPVGDNERYIVDISWNKLLCRPCTVYGKGICRRGDFACMEWITGEQVLNILKLALGSNSLEDGD